MPNMPKIGLNLTILVLGLSLIAIAIGTQQHALGKSIVLIDTGNHQSASWQFTNELSELWRKNFPELDTTIVPAYTADIEKRFENLQLKNSRFVIAPLTTSVNQIMLNLPIKLVAVLWEVYVVPIDLGNKNEAISLNNHINWYVTEKSVIIPELMRALNKPYFAESIRAEYQFRKPFVGQSKTQTRSDSSHDNQLSNESVATNSYSGTIQPLIPLDETDPSEKSQTFEQSARIAGLEDFDTNVLQVENGLVQEIVSEYREGILFFEMMGSIRSLDKALENELTTTKFKQSIRDFLISVHPWIQPVYKRRVKLKTLGFNMALFVHDDEDPEFVETLVKLLATPQKSYFPTSFIFRNLSIQKTKEISPIYMHAGSLKFFSMD